VPLDISELFWRVPNGTVARECVRGTQDALAGTTAAPRVTERLQDRGSRIERGDADLVRKKSVSGARRSARVSVLAPEQQSAEPG
jgi:hypothetical protein